MSAFVVSSSGMDRCVEAILHKNTYGYVTRLFCGKPLEQWEPTELGRMLYALNTSAVAQRYSEPAEDKSDYQYKPVPYSEPRVASIFYL